MVPNVCPKAVLTSVLTIVMVAKQNADVGWNLELSSFERRLDDRCSPTTSKC